MARKATVTQADMGRAIRAAQDAGLTIRECEMTAEKVRLIFEDGPASVEKPVANPKLKQWPASDQA